jgi:hypothetical protein
MVESCQRIRTLLLIGILGPVFSLCGVFAKAEVIFEGYGKINAGSRHVGFYVQRYEFDPKKKEFVSVYLIKTDPAGGDISESLKAVSNDKFQPLSYQYTSKAGNTVKVIDAKFKGQTMNYTLFDGKTKQNLTRQIPKGTFLSTFTQYLMLQQGYEIGKKFSFNAIAEEEAAVFPGEAFIKEEMDFKDVKGFRVLYDFKNSKFIAFFTPKGEVLGTVSPVQDITTELVANPAEATMGNLVQNKTLQLLFGKVPEGKINALARASAPAATKPKSSPAPAPMPKPAQTPAPKAQ